MKKLLVCVIAIAGLSACGQKSSSDTTAVPEPVITTTTVAAVTTTTVASKFNPASGEKNIDCDNKAIGALYGEKLKLEKCTATWAMGDTDQDRWNCPKVGCDQTRLYHLVDGKWSTTAICYRNQPLTRYAISCYIPNAGGATLAEIPPSDVACNIWAANRELAFVEETGCTPSESDIQASLAGACTGYFTAVKLPIEKCDQGPLVTALQKKLRAAGYTVDIDGYFGPGMAKAVYKFQSDKGLAKMGFINEATWKALTTSPIPS